WLCVGGGGSEGGARGVVGAALQSRDLRCPPRSWSPLCRLGDTFIGRFRFLVASPPVRDLLLCAKDLFVAAKHRGNFALLGGSRISDGAAEPKLMGHNDERGQEPTRARKESQETRLPLWPRNLARTLEADGPLVEQHRPAHHY